MQYILLNINPLVPMLFMIPLLLIVGIFYWFYKKGKREISVLKEKLNTVSHERDLKNSEIAEFSKEVDLHQEELITQTEHLKGLNVEFERLSLVASKTDTSVIIANENGEFTWVNHGFEKLYGYTLEEYREAVGIDIHTASTKENISGLVKSAFQEKKALNYTSKILTKAGASKWLKVTLNPIFDNGGNFKQYVIIAMDITKLQLANKELKKLSLVAEKTSNAVAIFNQEGCLDWINEGFFTMYGYTKENFIERFGNSIEDFLTMNDKQHLLDKLKTTKQEIRFINSVNNKLNQTVWKQTIVTPVYGTELENYVVVESDITRLKEAEHSLIAEKEKADKLLLNILPEETSEELKSKGKATPRFYRSVSVLFADLQGFTKSAEAMTPAELVEALQLYFSHFDDAVSRYFVEKIKTMGDAFLCVGGIPMRNKSHPFDTVLVGLELQRIMLDLAKIREEQGLRGWQLRVGIHSGSVVAGVVGKQKMTYDIWGDSVNIAKRIESACVPGMVNVSSPTYEIIKDYFECEHRGKILAKNKGHIDMYFVHRIKSEFSEKGLGIVPNTYFKEMLAQL